MSDAKDRGMAKLLKPPDAREAQVNQPRSIAIIRETIRKKHGCDSKYCRTVHVVDTVDGRVACQYRLLASIATNSGCAPDQNG